MSFSESVLLKKFADLNNTQQSVQMLSLWLIHYRKYASSIVKTWYKELMNATKCERKITFMYLANDILQNSRKKGPEYQQEFVKVLNDAVENTAKCADEKTRFTLERILNIWKDRKIFNTEATVESLRKILYSTKQINELNSPPLTRSPPATTSKSPAIKRSSSGTSLKSAATSSRSRLSEGSTSVPTPLSPSDLKKRKLDTNVPTTSKGADQSGVSAATKLNLTAMSLREEIQKELENNQSNIQVPDPVELINMLQELEKSASSDAVVREKIAELPPEVNDISHLERIKDRKEAMELASTVGYACSLLDIYNGRLQEELVNRKKTALSLAAFIRYQQSELENDQKLIDEWKRKLKQVQKVRQDLQKHMESLPDLSSIDEAAGLIPLPSAGDLFASNKNSTSK